MQIYWLAHKRIVASPVLNSLVADLALHEKRDRAKGHGHAKDAQAIRFICCTQRQHVLRMQTNKCAVVRKRDCWYCILTENRFY